jgi:nicotinamidase-related amidase
MLTLDPKTTALVVIDLQQGVLALPLTPHGAAEVVARSAGLGHAFARAGATVVLVNVDYSDGYADRPAQPADAPMGLPAEGLPEGWATLVPEVAALAAQVRVTKRQQSAFYGTELDLQLRRRGIVTVVLCGVATNFGVEATARDAHNANYAVVIAADACSSVAPGLHEFAVTNILTRIARVRGTAEIIAALDGGGRAG